MAKPTWICTVLATEPAAPTQAAVGAHKPMCGCAMCMCGGGRPLHAHASGGAPVEGPPRLPHRECVEAVMRWARENPTLSVTQERLAMEVPSLPRVVSTVEAESRAYARGKREERERVVAWLREQADLAVTVLEMDQHREWNFAALQIERGDHDPPTDGEGEGPVPTPGGDHE